MLIYLYGPDSYRRRQKARELIEFYRQKHPQFDFASFDLAESSENYFALRDFLNQQSLFENFKMAFVSGVFEIEPKKIKPTLREQLIKEDSAFIVSEREKAAEKFDFLLEKPVYCQSFESLTGGKLAFFLEKEAKRRNLNFSPEASAYLRRWQESLKADSWALINELNKISLADLPQPIIPKHLEELVPFSFREKIFDLARVLVRSNSSQNKLSALERLLVQKEPAAYIFNLLGCQAPADLLADLADYDCSIKSGGLGYEEALLDLALKNS